MINKIKISQLNKGNSNLINRVEHINNILITDKPDIIVINELNLYQKDLSVKYLFPNYNMEHDSLDKLDKCARTAILIHRNLKYKRRRDLEASGISSVWIQLNQVSKSPLLIQGLYRQFQRINNQGTTSYKTQYERWEQVIQKWEQAMSENVEIITCGDLNLNKLEWNKPEAMKNDYEKAKTPMIEKLVNRILNKGHVVINQKPTKIPKLTTEKPSVLDLLITNSPESIINHNTIENTFSDHAMITMTRRSKPIKKTKTNYKNQIFKKF